MSGLTGLSIIWLPFVAISWWSQRQFSLFRDTLCASLAVATTYFVFYYFGGDKNYNFQFAYFLTVVSLNYAVLLLTKGRRYWWIAAAFGPAILLLGRASNVFMLADFAIWFGSWSLPYIVKSGFQNDYLLAAFSYTVLRLSLLAFEHNNGKFEFPNFFQYLFYAVFPPLMIVGPISSYAHFADWLQKNVTIDRSTVQDGLLRITVGVTKYFVLSSLVFQWTLTRLGDNFDVLSTSQLISAILIYPVYLYLNFSGVVDMAVGASSLLGIRVMENFDRPLTAVNISDFWQRWHISLTEYLRTAIYYPIMISAARAGIPVRMVSFFAIFLVFLAVGLFHGFTWNFALLGSYHACCLIGYQLIRPFVQWLPTWISIALTYLTVAFGMVLFENSWAKVLSLIYTLSSRMI